MPGFVVDDHLPGWWIQLDLSQQTGLTSQTCSLGGSLTLYVIVAGGLCYL